MAQVDLNIELIPQLSGLCGPACAQMILHWKLPAEFDDHDQTQRDIWTNIQKLTDGPGPDPPPKNGLGSCPSFPQQICECKSQLCWCTHPTALSAELGSCLSPEAFTVVTVNAPSKDQLTLQVLQILGDGWAPVVLVHRGSHWVVVEGCDYTDGSPIDLRTLTLQILDPELPAPLNGVRDTFWNGLYLSAVWCGAYKDNYVMVAPVEAPRAIRLRAKIGKTKGAPVQILDPVEILNGAEVERLTLTKYDKWQPAFSHANAVPEREVLVEDLDSGLLYYVVDFVTEGVSTGRMILDARSGEVGQFIGVAKTGESLPNFAFPKEVRLYVDHKEVKFGDGTTLVIDWSLLTVDPRLVWRASDQSHTPMIPFYSLHQGGHDFYLRADGTIVATLTLYSAGA